jgi:phosphoglycolate phosphatase
MPKPLLVFDLDGTLADTAPDLIATLDAVLPRHGFERPTAADFREGVGHGARALIEYALKVQGTEIDAPRLDAILADYLAYYEENICVGTGLFPGALDLLDRFEAKGWGFAVCTNKPERMSELLLSRLGVRERFAAIKGGDSFPYRKPDPAHLLDTITAAGGVRDEAILIGDSRTDLDTARNARVPFIGVTFGYTPVPMAALQPDLLAESFDAILPEAAARLLDKAGRAARLARSPAPAAP